MGESKTYWAGDLEDVTIVQIGDFVDLGAGCYLKLTDDGWWQCDGGYCIQAKLSEGDEGRSSLR